MGANSLNLLKELLIPYWCDVTAFLQGNPIMNEENDIMYLRADCCGALNGHQELFTGPYEPVFFVRKNSGITSTVNGERYKSLTFFIQPKKIVYCIT